MSDQDITCPTCGQRLESEKEKRRKEQNRLAQQKFRDKHKHSKQSISNNNQNVSIVSNSVSITSVQEKLSTGKKKAEKATRLSPDWFLPNSWGEWAITAGKSRDEIKEQADQFKDFWIAKSGKDAAKLDWFATWRNWIRNSKMQFRGKPKRDDAKDIEDFINIIKGTNSERT